MKFIYGLALGRVLLTLPNMNVCHDTLYSLSLYIQGTSTMARPRCGRQPKDINPGLFSGAQSVCGNCIYFSTEYLAQRPGLSAGLPVGC